jgi:hypothetical protein
MRRKPAPMTGGFAVRVLAPIENATEEIAGTWQNPTTRAFRSENHAPST